MNFLLFDFGASRIKSISYDVKTNNFSEIYSTPGASLSNKDKVSMEFFLDSFQQHLSYRYSKNEKIDAINICSEMHGFCLTKDLKNIKKDNYVSWRIDNCKDLKSEIDFYFPKNDFKKCTGMQEKNGLPIFNLRAHENYNHQSFFLTLPESIISIFGEWNGTMSKSLAASTGLYNILTNEWLGKVKKIQNIQFPIVNSEIRHSYGHIKFNKKNIPVYGGIGDLQSCYLSLDLKENEMNVNLGTGSQVSKTYQKYDKEFELRPTFNNEIFSTITHIPCGRALNIFSNAIEKKFKENNKKTNITQNIFWEKFFQKSDINSKNNIDIDLNVFKGSYKYKNGGSLRFVERNNIDLQVLVDSIKFSLVKQYSDIINYYNKCNDNSINKIIVTGALANKIVDFKDLLNLETNIEVEIMHNKIDSSLIGLSKISKRIYEK